MGGTGSFSRNRQFFHALGAVTFFEDDKKRCSISNAPKMRNERAEGGASVFTVPTFWTLAYIP
jgi:hypothetical protein